MKRFLLLPLLVIAASCSQGTYPLEGPFLILSTPYTSEGEVDYDNLVKEACFASDWDIPGVIWPQSNDAIDLLTQEERFKGMEALVKEWSSA